MVHNLKTDSGYGLSPSSFVTCNITHTTICLRCVPDPYSTMTISHYLITASYIIREYALSRMYYRLIDQISLQIHAVTHLKIRIGLSGNDRTGLS